MLGHDDMNSIMYYSNRIFAVGGGIENSLSLLEHFSLLEKKLDIKMKYTQLPWRESNQKVFVTDIKMPKKLLDGNPKHL